MPTSGFNCQVNITSDNHFLSHEMFIYCTDLLCKQALCYLFVPREQLPLLRKPTVPRNNLLPVYEGSDAVSCTITVSFILDYRP